MKKNRKFVSVLLTLAMVLSLLPAAAFPAWADDPAPDLTITYEYPQQVAVVMNDRAFQKLTKEQQEILLDEINKAGDYVTDQALNKSGEIIEKMKKEYGVELIETDLAPWRAKMEPFIEELENKNYIPKGYAARVRAIQ